MPPLQFCWQGEGSCPTASGPVQANDAQPRGQPLPTEDVEASPEQPGEADESLSVIQARLCLACSLHADGLRAGLPSLCAWQPGQTWRA